MRKRISDLIWSLVIYCPLRALPPTATQEVGGQCEQGIEYGERMWAVGLLKRNQKLKDATTV